jgi:hypothetical protein
VPCYKYYLSGLEKTEEVAFLKMRKEFICFRFIFASLFVNQSNQLKDDNSQSSIPAWKRWPSQQKRDGHTKTVKNSNNATLSLPDWHSWDRPRFISCPPSKIGLQSIQARN